MTTNRTDFKLKFIILTKFNYFSYTYPNTFGHIFIYLLI
jgi:hypothetical protein